MVLVITKPNVLEMLVILLMLSQKILSMAAKDATIYNARYYFEGAINVLPYYQREPTRLAFNHIADVIKKVVENTIHEPIFGPGFQPTDATYDPVTGIMVATIGTHSLTTDDYVWFKEDAITFSCDTGSGPTNHASPEAHIGSMQGLVLSLV